MAALRQSCPTAAPATTHITSGQRVLAFKSHLSFKREKSRDHVLKSSHRSESCDCKMTKKIDDPQATHHEKHADIVAMRLQEGVEVRQRPRVEGLSRFRGLLRQHRLARRRHSPESVAVRAGLVQQSATLLRIMSQG